MSRPFIGQIAIDVRNSTQDWDADTQAGSTIKKVVVDLSGDHDVDLEHEAIAAMKRD